MGGELGDQGASRFHRRDQGYWRDRQHSWEYWGQVGLQEGSRDQAVSAGGIGVGGGQVGSVGGWWGPRRVLQYCEACGVWSMGGVLFLAIFSLSSLSLFPHPTDTSSAPGICKCI